MQATSGSEGSWAGGRGGRVLRYSEAASLASALEICPDLRASPSCQENSSPGESATDSVGLRGEGPAGAVGCRKDLGGEGATGAVGLGGEGPAGAVGCGREGATLGGEGSTDTVGCEEMEGISFLILVTLGGEGSTDAVGCEEREGLMDVRSRLDPGLDPWTSTAPPTGRC